jgi:hypothetical protein
MGEDEWNERAKEIFVSLKRPANGFSKRWCGITNSPFVRDFSQFHFDLSRIRFCMGLDHS